MDGRVSIGTEARVRSATRLTSGTEGADACGADRGWDGGFGTSWLVDPNHHLTVIVLTQRVFETAAAPRVHVEVQAAAYAALI